MATIWGRGFGCKVVRRSTSFRGGSEIRPGTRPQVLASLVRGCSLAVMANPGRRHCGIVVSWA